MITHYRGWIPTVTGRLSFSHFGDNGLPRSKSITRTDGVTRFLFVHQRRTIWDVMLPSWPIFEKALGFKGRAHFVCIAETDDIPATNERVTDKQGKLVGRVFIVTSQSRWKSKLLPSIESVTQALRDYEVFPTSTPLKTYMQKNGDDLIGDLAEHCAFQCRFVLKRNGVIDIASDSAEKRAADAPEFPTESRQHAVTSQIFSFLRDVGHVHQHHSKSSDTIVDLHEFDNSDDVSWRLKTLYSIYRRIITFKRQSDIAVQIQCVGLIAYAQAFKEGWLEDHPSANKDREIPVFYDEAMKESIRSSELKMRYKSQRSTERWEIVRTVTVALIGLVLSFAGLIKVSDNEKMPVPPSSALMWLTGKLLLYPFQIGGIVCAVVLFAVFVRARQFRLHERWLFRFVQAVSQPYGQRLVALLVLVAAIFGILLGVITAFGWHRLITVLYGVASSLSTGG